MDRKFESAASGSPPDVTTLSSTGYPTNGDPAGGVPATKPGAGWFYSITEELLAVIVDGGLTPNRAVLTQLRDAIRVMATTGGRGVISGWLERIFGGNADKPTTDTSFVIVPDSSIIEIDGTGLGAFTTEVHAMAYVAGGTGSIRLWDITAGAIIGALQTFTNTTPALVKITGLSGGLATANHQLRLEVKGAAPTDLPVVYGARLLLK